MTIEPCINVDNDKVGWGEWDDEVRDKKVKYMVRQINQGHQFSKTEWPGGDGTLPVILDNIKKPNVAHKKNTFSSRRKKLSL